MCLEKTVHDQAQLGIGEVAQDVPIGQHALLSLAAPAHRFATADLVTAGEQVEQILFDRLALDDKIVLLLEQLADLGNGQRVIGVGVPLQDLKDIEQHQLLALLNGPRLQRLHICFHR